MSRSNNTEIINPSKFYYEWVGSKGCLKYFDKNIGEKGEQVFVDIPFTFLVLDRLSTIKGFSDADKSGFWSNEIRDIKKEPFTVRTKKGIVANGLYSSLAPILNQGAAYCQSVYIAVKGADGNLMICNFQIHGSAIGPWIDLCRRKDIYKYAITIAKSTPMKKGATNYFTPVFSLNPNVTEKTNQEAIALDIQLQEYLNTYFSRNTVKQQESVTVSDIVSPNAENIQLLNTQLAESQEEPVYEDDLPF